MRRILAQARKELTQISRDRLALTLALALPLVLVLLLSNAIALTVTDLPLVVLDFDSSPQSRELIAAYRASLSFRVVSWPTSRPAEEALSSNTAKAVLIIPSHFGRDVLRRWPTEVQVLMDATDANTAKLMQGYSTQIIRAYTQAGRDARPLVGAQTRLWYNPGRESRKFYAPGMFVLGLSMFPPLLAALAMSKEGEQKTILQVYASSISAHEFLLGKILAFMLIAMAEWLVSLTAMFVVFGLGFAGDPTPLLVGTVFYAFCVATYGTLIGAAIPNQAAAIQAVALGGFLLVFLLSGLIFPVENIPASLRWISNII
ncbi:MAG TPA: ABC transporter permease, partial [Bryobacteraceae bacterium]|nr:ABC transporter permease [Bryobacteraceae bacterium]